MPIISSTDPISERDFFGSFLGAENAVESEHDDGGEDETTRVEQVQFRGRRLVLAM